MVTVGFREGHTQHPGSPSAAAAVLTGSGLKHADLNDLVAAGITAAIVRLAAAGDQRQSHDQRQHHC